MLHLTRSAETPYFRDSDIVARSERTFSDFFNKEPSIVKDVAAPVSYPIN